MAARPLSSLLPCPPLGEGPREAEALEQQGNTGEMTLVSGRAGFKEDENISQSSSPEVWVAKMQVGWALGFSVVPAFTFAALEV